MNLSTIVSGLGDIASRLPLPTGRPEPVVVLDVAKLAITVAVGYGWLALDTVQEATVASGAGAAVWLVLCWLTRDQVTPVSAPVTRAGEQLVPAAVPDTSGGAHEKPS